METPRGLERLKMSVALSLTPGASKHVTDQQWWAQGSQGGIHVALTLVRSIWDSRGRNLSDMA